MHRARSCPLKPAGWTVVLTLVLGAPSVSAQSIDALYRTNCISCHGDGLRGGSAASMLDDRWTTDGSDRDLFDAIKHGVADLGMPAFAGGLSDAQMWSLVVFIREQRYAHRRAREGNAQAVDGIYTSTHHRFRVQTLIEAVPGVDRPWSIDFLPDGRMLFTERSGSLYLHDLDTGTTVLIEGTPRVWEHGQGGLLDIGVHPAYAQNGWIYLSYADRSDRNRGMTAVVRGKLEETGPREPRRIQWVRQQTVFRSSPAMDSPSGAHFGSRFVFDGAGHVFFTIGDRGQRDRAQQLDKPNGKVHRINDDGSIPADNPFVGRGDAMASVWSYGHRNPQGLAMHPVTGALYDVEHGPRGGDEINRVRPGGNYGWPVVSYTINYNGTPFGDSAPWHAERGLLEPAHYWVPAIAACGAGFYTGDKFPAWRNDLFVAALAKTEIHRVRFADDGESVVEDEVLLRGIGRVRDVVTGPDGCLYVAVEQPGRIVRLTPAQSR